MIAQVFPDDPATLLTGLAAILCLSSTRFDVDRAGRGLPFF